MSNHPLDSARWIWTGASENPLNARVLFKKQVSLEPRETPAGIVFRHLHLTANARYQLWVNGRWTGEGPARSWPDELFFDTYDLSEILEGCGAAEIRILVHHFSPGAGFYVVGEPGLAAALVETDRGQERILLQSDRTWECAHHPGYREPVVKMSNGMGYGEVYRADTAEDPARWEWQAPRDLGPAVSEYRRIVPRDIPLLEEKILTPQGLSGIRPLTSRGFFRSINLRPLVYPGDHDINKHKRFSGILEVGIQSPVQGDGAIGLTVDPHDTRPIVFFIGNHRFIHQNGQLFPVPIPAGITGVRILISGEYHDPVFHLQFDLPEGARLIPPRGEDSANPFVFVGPFNPSSHIQVSEPVPPAETESLKEEELLKKTGGIRRTVPEYCISPHHTALEYLTSLSSGRKNEDFYIQRSPDSSPFPLKEQWEKGKRVEILWDFGREVSGFLEFRISCASGTRLDCFCFESMHDGFIEHAFSLNNSLRYYASEGVQHYTSTVRRGFRYVAMILDGGNGKAVIESFGLRERLYPRKEEGSFLCPDEELTRIWEISARTVSLCMEDTYVDCPAYEQTYWTGDARNTALYSYYLCNAGPLFLRGARLAARSLERSPLIESMVPSAWQNVIPSWSFFHVLAGAEYLFYTGEEEGFLEIFPSLMKNMENAAERRVVMPDGSLLFAMHAWNMVDWAPMDVPDSGIIAHQNAQFVLACRSLSAAAADLGRHQEAELLSRWAEEGSLAVNRWFWSEEETAYRDCLSRDLVPSRIFSVQTQIFMFLAGLVPPAHIEAVKNRILSPPEHYVRIASPFVHHFYLDLLLQWGHEDLVLKEIRTVWGNMLSHDATTCWEGWALIPGHYTRSHCHAWSAAPVFFLPTLILGIRPAGRAFQKVLIRPYPAGLHRAEGSLATPMGLLSISWKTEGRLFHLEVNKPEAMEVEYILPEGFLSGRIRINDQIL